MKSPRVGGFVIHGDNADTLEACLAGLEAVCDDVVAVDSSSSDGSVDIVRRMGVRSVSKPWQGYGAARQTAVEHLADCDYVFYLDADEWIERDAQEAMRKAVHNLDGGPGLRLPRRNWAETQDGERWLYGTDWRFRAIRRDLANWDASMIVHEALPRMPIPKLRLFIEHHYIRRASSRRTQKDVLYALLWAVQQANAAKRDGSPRLKSTSRFLKDFVIKGAAFRGGADALGVCRSVARTHGLRYELLQRARAGEFAALQDLYERGELVTFFAHARRRADELASTAGV